MTSVTVEQTYRAMSEVAYGTNVPNVKLAFWSAGLSCRVKLHLNEKYTRIMSSYVNKPLPLDENVLIAELGGHDGKMPCGLMGSHIRLLYCIEKLYNTGILNFDCGNTVESQQVWREKMVELIPGMGSKLVSWACFIYNPFDCKLLTIDCWHCKRLGIEQGKLSGTSKVKQEYYKQVEKRMVAECIGLYPEYPPVVVAAMLWQNIRLANNASNETEEYQSHKGISCRWY